MICLRYGGSRYDAHDMLQNGLIRIFTSLSGFNAQKGTFGVWSNRIMVNEALRFLQRQQRLRFVEIGEHEPLTLDHHADLFSSLSAKDLVNLIQQLPIGYRTVFNLYAIEGYSHREISEQLQISVNTSKSQLSKAKKMLRSWIEVLL